MDLSIVIPVYNEEKKIRQDLLAASAYLHSRAMHGEIIVADDGSTDQTARVVSEILLKEGTPVHLVRNETHRGKGHAVKSGVLQARANLIMFIDSGSCVPYDNIDIGIELLKSGTCRIAHGSRLHPDSIIKRSNTPFRRFISSLFRRLIRIIVKLPGNLEDTQCGLKIYTRQVAHELYAECITEGFMFDIEVIVRAHKQGYSIREFPIEWTSDPDSRLTLGRSLFKILSELLGIRRIRKN